MSWNEIWRGLIYRFRSPSAAQCEANIDDELMFHFRSLVDEHLSSGMPADAAWRAAQERFGSLRRYSEDCHRVISGAHPMLQNISAVGLLVLALLVTWLFMEVRSLRQARAAPPPQSIRARQAAQQPPAEKQNAAAEQNDLAGVITDRQGKPLAKAHVLVILKTWPNQRYRQQDFSAKTDDEGRFRFSKLLPTTGQRAVHLAAVKDGYALTSIYELKKEGESFDDSAFKLKLDEAVPMKLTVRDARGRPAAKARVIPFSRRTAAGGEHLVYFQAAKPIELTADDKGSVSVDVFQRGDKAMLYVALPGKDWEQRPLDIPQTGDTLEVASTESLDGK